MTWNEDNGILAKLQGDFISRGLQSLPRPSKLQPKVMHAEVDVPECGRVRIRYVLKVSKHHKSHNFFWNASHAELIGKF